MGKVRGKTVEETKKKGLWSGWVKRREGLTGMSKLWNNGVWLGQGVYGSQSEMNDNVEMKEKKGT